MKAAQPSKAPTSAKEMFLAEPKPDVTGKPPITKLTTEQLMEVMRTTRTYIRVTYVAMSPYGKPIVTAHTEKDLKAGLDEYYGIGKDPKAKYLDWTPYDSKYPDDFEGTYRYEVDDFNEGLELEEVKVYCIDFYPHTKYEVEDSI